MIALGIIFVVFIVFILLILHSIKGRSYRVVIAGDVNTDVNLTAIRNLSRLDFVFEDKNIDPRKYDIFVVLGDSMKEANIQDKDIVFVQKLQEEYISKIEGNPVLVIEIDRSKDEDSKSKGCGLKLRKFISCVEVKNSFDFDNWLDKLQEKHKELSLFKDKKLIKEKFDNCVNKYKECNTPSEDDKIVFIFSQTNAKGDKIPYSFHPMKFLYGKVEYIVKEEYLQKNVSLQVLKN